MIGLQSRRWRVEEAESGPPRSWRRPKKGAGWGEKTGLAGFSDELQRLSCAMDRDEKMGYLLGGLAAAWAVGGLLLLALAAQRIRDAGVAVPGLEEGLAAFYLAVFGALAIGSFFFTIRSYWQSGDLLGILVLILELLLIIPLGWAVLRLLRGG
jgi:hypothetical protein